MAKALIGGSGFVGGNLRKQQNFEYEFNSQNISEIAGLDLDMAVCAAPAAVKWKANQFPEEDWQMVSKLIHVLKNIKTKLFIHISTVDVYASPIDLNEDFDIKTTLEELHPYGKHRFLLEQSIQETFPRTIIVRLPALFGPGLKKNFIYDLMNNQALDYTHKDSRFQFYYLNNLWSDISVAIENDLSVVNFNSEPVSAEEIAKKCFQTDFSNITERSPASYDIKTKYDIVYGGQGGYMYSRPAVFDQIVDFLEAGGL